jgi:hypothetical protein
MCLVICNGSLSIAEVLLLRMGQEDNTGCGREMGDYKNNN